jgi:hypothetical protein
LCRPKDLPARAISTKNKHLCYLVSDTNPRFHGGSSVLGAHSCEALNKIRLKSSGAIATGLYSGRRRTSALCAAYVFCPVTSLDAVCFVSQSSPFVVCGLLQSRIGNKKPCFRRGKQGWKILWIL